MTHRPTGTNAEISHFFRTGRYREIGLLLADRKMQPSLDRFMADRATHFPKLHPGAAIALAIGVTIAMLGLVEALML